MLGSPGFCYGVQMNKESYNRLVRKAHDQGLCVRQVKNKVTRDYVGMNSRAAKSLGFKMPPRMIYIDRDLPLSTKVTTLNHELIEVNLMKQGDSYWTAHKKALRRERKLR